MKYLHILIHTYNIRAQVLEMETESFVVGSETYRIDIYYSFILSYFYDDIWTIFEAGKRR